MFPQAPRAEMLLGFDELSLDMTSFAVFGVRGAQEIRLRIYAATERKVHRNVRQLT